MNLVALANQIAGTETKHRVESIIRQLVTLKPIPQVANQIMALAEEPNSSMSEIAELVACEPMITANFLRMCNSAYFGLKRPVESVNEAIVLLGLDQVVDLVILQYASENLQKAQTGYHLGEGALWKQALTSAFIAREISARKAVDQKHLIFTATLLKDIGKVVLGRYVSSALAEISALVRNNELGFEEAEKQVIGIDHAELGAMIAENWKFSPKMVYIIRNHHMSDPLARQDLETSVVYLADMVSMMAGVDYGLDRLSYKFYENIFKRMDISEEDLAEIMAGYRESQKKVEGLLGMF